jgi:chromosome segregation ATPase
MVMEFIKSFVGIKGKEAVQAVVTGLASVDPAAASKADMEVMEKDLDATGRHVAQLRADLAREKKEYDAVAGDYDRMYAAAEHLGAQMQGEADAGRKGELEKSLTTLVTRLSELKPRLDQEKQDVDDVQGLLTEAEALYKAKSQAMVEAKRNLQGAVRDMERAHIQKQQAEKRAEQAAQLAGLREGVSTSKLNTALNAFNQKAEQARKEAEMLRMKADALKPVDTVKDDPNITAALAAAGKPALPAGNAAAMLAALKR